MVMDDGGRTGAAGKVTPADTGAGVPNAAGGLRNDDGAVQRPRWTVWISRWRTEGRGERRS